MKNLDDADLVICGQCLDMVERANTVLDKSLDTICFECAKKNYIKNTKWNNQWLKK